MKTSTLLRAPLLAAALAAALSAQAVTIGLSSVGTFDNSAAPVLVTNETVINQQGGFGPLATLQLNYMGGPLPEVGTGFYTGAGGTLNFSFVYNTSQFGGGTQFLSGTWAATGGTGTYANANGLGTLGTVFDLSGGGPVYNTYTTFRGTIEAVPEPATMAALGLGLLGVARRRRKSVS